MPNDQTHVFAFLAALSSIASIGVGAFVYIWRTTPKREPSAEQQTFDFAGQPERRVSKKLRGPPMARV